MRTRSKFLVIAMLTVGCSGFMLGGIGETDTANLYANVGALALRVVETDMVYSVCSGVLIDSDVFLTAGHCTAWLEPLRTAIDSGDLELLVTFEPNFYTGNFILADDFVTHPMYGHDQANPYDLSVVLLPDGSTAGLIPAELPAAGLLDDLKKAGGKKGTLDQRILFELAGYGVVPSLTGPPLSSYDGWRRWSTSPFSALLPYWLMHQQNQNAVDTEDHGGSCGGDSGAPHFYPGTNIVVAIVSWGDIPCRTSDFSYRLDTEAARDFLGAFVNLP